MELPKVRRSKKFDVRLPAGFSRGFVQDLLSSLPDDGFKSSYLKSEILSKYVDSSTTPPELRARAAVAKWLAAECRNSVTNTRLFSAQALGVDFGWALWDDILSQARLWVRRVLVSHDECSPLERVGRFSNGARTDQKRGPTAALRTLTGSIHVSSSALADWLQHASNTRLSSNPVEITDESVMFTVPKKTDIDRVACKEPSGNAYLQRLVGKYISRRLRRFGIDLRDQSRNRNLARIGSIQGNLATIDLSSASDSISEVLVQQLLPFEWWSFLDDIRIKTVHIPQKIHPEGVDHVHTMEMFSSMGNGFTFELESLIFWALARAVMNLSDVRGVVSVYGDDIIVPVTITPRLIRVFHFCGFRTNSSKTFYKGKFRESCGGHYYAGFDVTPFYVRREVQTLPDLISLLNQILEWDGRGWGFFTTPSLAKFHSKWSRHVPKRLHGGINPDDPTCLVTGDGPRFRLCPMVKPASVDYSADACLTHWLMSKESPSENWDWQCTHDPVVINPQKEIGFELSKVISAGERTTWTPYMISII